VRSSIPTSARRCAPPVQLVPGVVAGGRLADALLGRCRAHLPDAAVPRTIDFAADVGRLPTDKLPKRALVAGRAPR
jgi:hypothetical protein